MGSLRWPFCEQKLTRPVKLGREIKRLFIQDAKFKVKEGKTFILVFK